ncbi:iron-sulfur cluster repair di-iron protein, partial [candidate division KSB1 bacterium]|nr:iron-sulfur cluster repair di-iron protein [candidate division KSB1 bacterium]
MTPIKLADTVGDVVTRFPMLSRVFEQKGIDYCCGGKKTLDEVCRERALDTDTLLALLEESASDRDARIFDAASLSLTELVDHIEQTHHAYLRAEFPHLDEMTAKVASVHGEKEPRLHQIRETFLSLADELLAHMLKEERILFPMIRQLDTAAPLFHCGSLANPIRQMEMEHDQAGSVLEKLRELSDDYAVPEWACNTYRALLHALVHLESDLH